MKAVKKEQKEMKAVQQKICKAQEDILEEIRIGNLRLAKVVENVTCSVIKNNKEHKSFDSRITEIEKKVI